MTSQPPIGCVLSRLLCCALVSSLLVASPFLLPVQAQITLDGSLGPRLPRRLEGPHYVIDAAVGERRGPNLFQSFGEFNIHRGEQATFTGPNDITNILSRVTGGNPSEINGTLRSEIAGANLFLLNPSGVLFGPNATLDVSGSFHVSTADYLRLSDGGRFAARVSESSVLSVAPPAAFGFLGPQSPAAITIAGSHLEVPVGASLSVVGGDITVRGTGELSFDRPTLTAFGGRMHLASAAGAGEIALNPAEQATLPGGTAVAHFGRVAVQQGALLDASSEDGGGAITIQGGRLQLVQGSGMATDTLGPGDGATLGVDLRVQGAVIISDASFVESGVFFGASGNAGDIRITAGSLEVRGGAFVGSPGSAGTTGARGNVHITVGRLLVTDSGSSIDTNTLSSGAGGAIRITADRVEVRAGARIAAEGLEGSTAVREDIVIEAGRLLVTQGARISTDTSGAGPGGAIRITADRVEIDAGAQLSSAGLAGSTGARGNVVIGTGSLLVAGGARLDTSTAGSGAGGNITITAAERITVTGRDGNDNQSVILSRTVGQGDAGRLILRAPRMMLHDGAIRAITQGEGSGNAGEIEAEVGRLTLAGGAQISSSTFGSGHGGTVTVRATEAITITGQNRSGGRSALTSTAQPGSTGTGGRVVVTAPQAALVLDDGGAVSAQTAGAGNAGEITVEVSSLTITGGAQIDSNTTGAGRAGNVAVTARQGMMIAGRDRDGNQSRIASSSRRREGGGPVGPGGRLTITAPTVTLEDGLIQVITETESDAGAVALDVGRLMLAGGAEITSSTTGAGHGGTVTVNATDMVLITGQGNAGPPSQLVSTTTSAGTGGSLRVQTRQMELRDGGRVAADSMGQGNAGMIEIQAGERFRSLDGRVTTTASSAGGGDIRLTANLVQMTDSQLTAAAMGAAGTGSDGGNITVQAQRVVLNHSTVSANAFGGNGGNIAIRATEVFLADAQTCGAGECLTASSELGVDGTVEVSAPVTNVSGSLAPLSPSFSTAPVLLSERCAERTAGSPASRFVLGGRDGVPIEPGQILPSPPTAWRPAPADRPPATSAISGQAQGRGKRHRGRGNDGQRLAQALVGVECALWRTAPAAVSGPGR